MEISIFVSEESLAQEPDDAQRLRQRSGVESGTEKERLGHLTDGARLV